MRPVLKSILFITLISMILTIVGLLAYRRYSIVLDNAATVVMSYLSAKTTLPVEHTFVSLLHVIDTARARSQERIANSDRPMATETNPQFEAQSEPAGNLGDAIVNIFCVQETRDYKRIMSGTGFFVTESGAILTNAHVAQFLLLKGASGLGDTKCEASTNLVGSRTYEVGLLYISPTWLVTHADMIDSDDPKGTGENDFALLYVIDARTNDNFAHIPLATNPLYSDNARDTVILVGYPHNKSSYKGTRAIATTTITELFTFGGGAADIFSLSPSILGHEGASGGPVIDHLGRAIGMVATKDEGTTALNAITTAHIDRALRTETGLDLISMLQGDLSEKAVLFNDKIAPILQRILTNNLE